MIYISDKYSNQTTWNSEWTKDVRQRSCGDLSCTYLSSCLQSSCGCLETPTSTSQMDYAVDTLLSQHLLTILALGCSHSPHGPVLSYTVQWHASARLELDGYPPAHRRRVHGAQKKKIFTYMALEKMPLIGMARFF